MSIKSWPDEANMSSRSRVTTEQHVVSTRTQSHPGGDIRLGERTLDRSAERLRPVLPDLALPRTAREIGLVCRGVRTARKAVKIEYKGAQAFSVAIHSDDVAHVPTRRNARNISIPGSYTRSDSSPNTRAPELRRLAEISSQSAAFAALSAADQSAAVVSRPSIVRVCASMISSMFLSPTTPLSTYDYREAYSACQPTWS